jgi:hypothetical protein
LLKYRKIEDISHYKEKLVGSKDPMVGIPLPNEPPRKKFNLLMDDEKSEEKVTELFLRKIKKLDSDLTIPLKDYCLKEGTNHVSFRSWEYFFHILKFLKQNEIIINRDFNTFLEDFEAVKAFTNYAYHDMREGERRKPPLFLDLFKVTEHYNWEDTTFYTGNSKQISIPHSA